MSMLLLNIGLGILTFLGIVSVGYAAHAFFYASLVFKLLVVILILYILNMFYKIYKSAKANKTKRISDEEANGDI